MTLSRLCRGKMSVGRGFPLTPSRSAFVARMPLQQCSRFVAPPGSISPEAGTWGTLATMQFLRALILPGCSRCCHCCRKWEHTLCSALCRHNDNLLFPKFRRDPQFSSFFIGPCPVLLYRCCMEFSKTMHRSFGRIQIDNKKVAYYITDIFECFEDPFSVKIFPSTVYLELFCDFGHPILK